MNIHILNDDDGHTYFVPVEQVDRFHAWLEAVYSYTDEDVSMPPGVVRANSHLSCYVFTTPELVP